jgi:hypothetical protein
MLSEDADQLRLICDADTGVAVRPVGTEGAAVSSVAGVLIMTACELLEEFPAASTALTVYEYVVDALTVESRYAVTSPNVARRTPPR